MKTWLGIVISFVLINSALAEIRWDIPEIHSAAVATIGDRQQVKPPPFGEIFRAWAATRRHTANLTRSNNPLLGDDSTTSIEASTFLETDYDEENARIFGSFTVSATTTQVGPPVWQSAASGGSGVTYYLVVTPEGGPHSIRVTTTITARNPSSRFAAGDYLGLVEVNAFDAEGHLLHNKYRRLVHGFNAGSGEIGFRTEQIPLLPGHYQIYIGVGGFLSSPRWSDSFSCSMTYDIAY